MDMGEPAWGAAGRIPTEGRSSVSTEQRENLDAILRQAPFPFDSDVSEQRRLLREVASAQPLPADVTVTAAVLGGVPTAEITLDRVEPRRVVADPEARYYGALLEERTLLPGADALTLDPRFEDWLVQTAPQR